MSGHEECIKKASSIMMNFKKERESHNASSGECLPEQVFSNAMEKANVISNTVIKEWIKKAIDASRSTGKLSAKSLHQQVKDFEAALPRRTECEPEILGLVMKLYKLCVWETMQHGSTTANNYDVDGRFFVHT